MEFCFDDLTQTLCVFEELLFNDVFLYVYLDLEQKTVSSRPFGGGCENEVDESLG